MPSMQESSGTISSTDEVVGIFALTEGSLYASLAYNYSTIILICSLFLFAGFAFFRAFTQTFLLNQRDISSP